ncbi:hypothetical protein M5K25_010546 [Dendrobium thyrsiflorum]|uniref:Uncharacterized protein n=1 Tax=Dendrobium thyrsiflorum TaxID=117978 RepID=A0ABD0V1G1_DENTH
MKLILAIGKTLRKMQEMCNNFKYGIASRRQTLYRRGAIIDTVGAPNMDMATPTSKESVLQSSISACTAPQHQFTVSPSQGKCHVDALVLNLQQRRSTTIVTVQNTICQRSDVYSLNSGSTSASTAMKEILQCYDVSSFYGRRGTNVSRVAEQQADISTVKNAIFVPSNTFRRIPRRSYLSIVRRKYGHIVLPSQIPSNNPPETCNIRKKTFFSYKRDFHKPANISFNRFNILDNTAQLYLVPKQDQVAQDAANYYIDCAPN